MNQLLNQIDWIQQSAIKINTANTNIFIDPFQLTEKDSADIILITHSHSDHFSEEDISKITTKNTLFIAPETCIFKDSTKNRKVLLPNESFTYNSHITIKAVPAYNIVKSKFHPKENNWVGYLITINGNTIYHTGDTERIPEMKDITCDIILLPLGQTYTMNSIEEAAQSVLDTKAKIAIPIHFGLYEGNQQDAISFQQILKDKVNVIIKERKTQLQKPN